MILVVKNLIKVRSTHFLFFKRFALHFADFLLALAVSVFFRRVSLALAVARRAFLRLFVGSAHARSCFF